MKNTRLTRIDLAPRRTNANEVAGKLESDLLGILNLLPLDGVLLRPCLLE